MEELCKSPMVEWNTVLSEGIKESYKRREWQEARCKVGSRAVAFQHQCRPQNHQENLSKHCLLDPTPRVSDLLHVGWSQDFEFWNTHLADTDAFWDYTLRSIALHYTVPGGPGDGFLICPAEKEKSLMNSKFLGDMTQFIFLRKKVTLASGWRKDSL